MSGPFKDDFAPIPANEDERPCVASQIAEILALVDNRSRSRVIATLEARLKHSSDRDDLFLTCVRLALVILCGPSVDDHREWFLSHIGQAPDIRTAALRVERLLRCAEIMNAHVNNDGIVSELETEWTKRATEQHLGRPASPPEFDLRLMARNTMAEVAQAG